MGTIFISYRRDDAEGQAGRLYRDLVAVFGSEAVFMDVAAIQPGRDFRKVIHQSLDSCGVFLALIGKGWLETKDGAGNRRLDDVADFVRIETAAALKRDIPVIPVLVHGAGAPKPEQLPDDLKDLAYRNAIELTHPRWDSDLQLLINALQPYVSAPIKPPVQRTVQPVGKERSSKTWVLLGAAAVVIVGAEFYAGMRQKAVVPAATQSTTDTTVPAANAPAMSANAQTEPTKEPTKHSPQKSAPPLSKPTPKAWSLDEITLGAQRQPLADNPKRYTFTLWLKTPAEIRDTIYRVHYDLVYDPNPLSLDGGLSFPFRTVYEGWGCYDTVAITITFKSEDGTEIVKKINRDGCKALASNKSDKAY